MKRAYKLRAYPTRPQEGRAVRLLTDHCDLYNAALQERREAWRLRQVKVSYGDQSAQLKEIRAADPNGQGRHSFTTQQQTLRRLNVVFTAYHKRVRDAEQRQQDGRKRQPKKRKVGYPRFKPYQRFDQVLFVAGNGAKWEPAGVGRWAHATFQAVGRVKVNQHRPVVGRVKTLQVKREHRRWYVVVVTETEIAPLPPTGRSVGADVGVARFLTTSDGEIVPNPRFLDAAQERIAAKSGLNRSILDAGWAQFMIILTAKAESAGRRVVRVEPSNTSLTCHACGARCGRPRQEAVICPIHGELDADLNGARNIATRAGLGSGQGPAA